MSGLLEQHSCAGMDEGRDVLAQLMSVPGTASAAESETLLSGIEFFL